jgi:hypothetical protein
VTKGQELAERCGMQKQVQYLPGDFIEIMEADDNDLFKEGSFTHFISMLVFLHLPARVDVSLHL